MTDRPKAISLFAGAGGCSLGFARSNYEVVYANDHEQSAVRSYRENFPETLVECKDIADVDFTHLLDRLGIRPGETDVLVGGPPCQGFSTAGPRFWDDPRNQLLKEYVRALGTIKPKWFLMENVEGLLTSNAGLYVTETVKAFVRLGYALRIEKVYSHEFGIPQRRKRVIILGNRVGVDFQFPTPTTYSHGKIFRNAKITLAHALDGLPTPSNRNVPLRYTDSNSLSWANDLRSVTGLVTEHFVQTVDELQAARIAALKPGETMKDLPEFLQHPSFRRRAMRRVKDGTPTEKRGGAPSGLKRLNLDEPSLTITGAAIREFVHPIENRCLTIRECARIQGFPDDFRFCGTNAEKIQQIANAIPPHLAKVFANTIRKYGFAESPRIAEGSLLGFILTKSEGLSPALQNTENLLSGISNNYFPQPNLFDHAY